MRPQRAWNVLLGLALAACAPLGTSPTSVGNTPAARPAVSEEFVATDPAVVTLAAGRPQFVEFFAFY